MRLTGGKNQTVMQKVGEEEEEEEVGGWPHHLVEEEVGA